MKFSAFSIKSQEFNKSVRGYDKDEVRTFLEQLSDEFEQLASENEKLKADISAQHEQLIQFKKIEKNLQNTLLNATESSNRTVESTKKQSALILKEAELKSAQMIENAKEKANEIRNSVLTLREERTLLIARLKAMISSQSSLLQYSLKNDDNIILRPKIEMEDKPSEINVDAIVEKLL